MNVNEHDIVVVFNKKAFLLTTNLNLFASTDVKSTAEGIEPRSHTTQRLMSSC